MSSYHNLLSLLHSGASFTYEEAAERLGVSQRQVRRLIAQAREEGVVVDTSKRGRKDLCSIPDHLRERAVRLDLAEEELEALALSAEAIGSMLGESQFGDALRRAVEKIRVATADAEEAAADDDDPEWFFSPHPKANLDTATLRALRAGIVDRRSIGMTYFSGARQEMTVRTVDPYAIAVLGSSWMLVAWCHERRDFRQFSIPDIRSAALSSPFLRKDFDLETHFAGAFGGVRGEKEEEIALILDEGFARAFERKKFHPSQKMERLEDGNIRVRFRVSGVDGFRSWVLSWGAKVVVETDGEFRATVARELRDAAAQYETDGSVAEESS